MISTVEVPGLKKFINHGVILLSTRGSYGYCTIIQTRKLFVQKYMISSEEGYLPVPDAYCYY